MIMTVHGTVMYWIIGINIALMIALISKNISALPAKIPLHFNFKGEADGIYTKYLLWIFPAINAGLIIFSINDPQSLIPCTLTGAYFVYLTFLIIEIAKNKIHKMPKSVFICILLVILGSHFFAVK